MNEKLCVFKDFKHDFGSGSVSLCSDLYVACTSICQCLLPANLSGFRKIEVKNTIFDKYKHHKTRIKRPLPCYECEGRTMLRVWGKDEQMKMTTELEKEDRKTTTGFLHQEAFASQFPNCFKPDISQSRRPLPVLHELQGHLPASSSVLLCVCVFACCQAAVWEDGGCKNWGESGKMEGVRGEGRNGELRGEAAKWGGGSGGRNGGIDG